MVDEIKHAIALARAAGNESRPSASSEALNARDTHSQPLGDVPLRVVRLDPDHLTANRIVAFGATAEHGRYYDMLRTQVLQEMDKKSWQLLAVTSPTAGCGKTVTACNLAISISRLPERQVLLVDLDLRKPMVANYLRLGNSTGIMDVLEGRQSLSSTVLRCDIGSSALMVLPGTRTVSGSAEWMASQTMGTLLQTIRREFRSCLVIFDLPPMLLGDDVISILPRMDASLLIAGIGSTSLADIKECQKHLQRTPVVRVVANKVTDGTGSYYGYY